MLVKNPKWRDAKTVKIGKVTFTDRSATRLRRRTRTPRATPTSTRSDLPGALVPKWKKSKEYKTYGTIGTYYYGFNVKNIPDVNQRRAMA